MIYLGKTSVGIAAITQGDAPNLSNLTIVLYDSSYQPEVARGRFVYQNSKYTCWVR